MAEVKGERKREVQNDEGEEKEGNEMGWIDVGLEGWI
jgi:hypothetical protein